MAITKAMIDDAIGICSIIRGGIIGGTHTPATYSKTCKHLLDGFKKKYKLGLQASLSNESSILSSSSLLSNQSFGIRGGRSAKTLTTHFWGSLFYKDTKSKKKSQYKDSIQLSIGVDEKGLNFGIGYGKSITNADYFVTKVISSFLSRLVTVIDNTDIKYYPSGIVTSATGPSGDKIVSRIADLSDWNRDSVIKGYFASGSVPTNAEVIINRVLSDLYPIFLDIVSAVVAPASPLPSTLSSSVSENITKIPKSSSTYEGPLNLILYGPPGTGKTYNTVNKAINILDPSFNFEVDRKLVKNEYNKFVGLGQIVFTTFHQSMSYEDFIEGIKPVIKLKTLKYEIKPGIFKDIVIKAKSDSTKNYVLIIDEINRGNISQIFGELITLIEEDKRIENKEELSATLPYSREEFGVPKNLYIIGTMNTADRSVEALDTALRRRFSFEEMVPQSELIKTVGQTPTNDGKVEGIDLVELLKTINNRIEKVLDKDHLIGHSYFLQVKEIKDLQKVFQNNIIPLLQEYFYGDFGKIGLVLGNGFVEKQDNVKDIFANFDYDDKQELSDRIIYKINDYKGIDDSKNEFINALNLLMNVKIQSEIE